MVLRMTFRLAGTLLISLTAAASTPLRAQAEFQGRVLTNADRPIAKAIIWIPALDLRTVSDSAGKFRIGKIPSGDYLILARAVGFRPESTVTTFEPNEALVHDIVLQASVNELPTVAVSGKSEPLVRGQLAEYEDRKARGIGHFFDGDVFEKANEQRLGDALNGRVPGMAIVSGKGARAWVTSGRGGTAGTCALCRASRAQMLDNVDIAAGAPLACYMDVYLDGMRVYSSGSAGRMPLFNVNNVNPHNVRAVEVYTSASQIPPKYVRIGNSCGVMLIWTRSTTR
jgi:hypothetical protein